MHIPNSMKNKLIRPLCLLKILLFFFIANSGIAQKTAIYEDSESHFKSGMELFNKEKYSAARKEFEKAVENKSGLSVMAAENASYYKAVCAAELFNPDAEALLIEFINTHPESLKLRLAYFQLGRLYYKLKKYRNATEAFEMADVYYLTNDEITEFYFKSGYGYFVRGDMIKAEKSFHNIINVESKYKTAANYYYAHIAYANDNYTTALTSFNKLNESESFGPIVPLYIAQIYFDQAKYDELVKYGVPLLENPKLQNAAEMRRLIAEAYFRMSDYKQALVYFREYQKSTPKISREDYYQKAFCLYQTGDYNNAIPDFQKVTDGTDMLAQSASYHLADCYLLSGNKQGARNSFQLAAKLSLDKEIQESSQFNYAKLSYELGFPSVAIKAFRDFQTTFPQSSRRDESNQLLADIYLTTHNYKDALAALEKIEKKTEKSKRAYQKVAYFRGIEYYNDRDLPKAISLFEKSIVNNTDPVISAQSMYWKAEALYAQEKYEAAMKEYRIFLFAPGTVSLPNFNLAHYNIGYCFFKLEDYAEAQIWFRKYLKNKAETDADRYNDASIRVADANFMLKEYDIALDFYNDAVADKAKGSDYCLFQKGMIYGIKGRMNDKAAAMQEVIARYKKSAYLDDAIYEKGNALLAEGKDEQSLEYFQKIVSEYPNSSYTRKSLINMGLVNFAAKNDEKALSYYRQVIEKYPSTPEASEALNGIKNIYVNSGNPGGYFDYVKSVPSASISAGAQDSITYEAAEQRYMKGAPDAGKDFANYLSQFPSGYFVLKATFYKAESDYKGRNFADALTGYEYVIAQSKNTFTETSLLKAAFINFRNKSFDKALAQYGQLEALAEFPENVEAARTGALRSSVQLNNCASVNTVAQKITTSDKVSKEVINEAHLALGKCALAAADYTMAQKELTLAAKVTNSVIGAEAKYNLAYLQYLLNNYKESQKLSFDVINQVPSYDFWIAKSFLLLADNYTALNDNFQAKSTLKSLIDNYEKNPDDTEDIRMLAGEKLKVIEAKEKELNKDLKEEQKSVKQENDSLETVPDGRE